MEENSSRRKKRRKPGTGMVRLRKDGFWEARLPMGEERKQVSRYAKSEKEARAILFEMKRTGRIEKIEKENEWRKRKAGTGTIRIRHDGTWECRLSVKQAGGMKPVSRYGKTEEEARAKLEELKAIVEKDPDYFLKYKKSKRSKNRTLRSLYFVQVGEDGPIKIGLARDVKRRVAGMQTGNHLPLNVIVCVPNATLKSEQALHEKFEYCRFRGEWFSPHPDLLAFVDQVLHSPEMVITTSPPPRAS